MNKRKTGKSYEKIAGEYLIRQGCEIIEYNFWCRTGEIDLITRQGNALVFVEVKYRKDEKYGFPGEAVTKQKQNQIRKTANVYLAKNGYSLNTVCRFDVVLLLGEQIEWIPDAF